MSKQVMIIGGGLSGLSLSYFLSKKKMHATILEGSARLGGRIQTIKGTNGTPLELGATWFSDMHPSLIQLLDELGLKQYPQYSKGISLFQTKSFEPAQKFSIPEAEKPSCRIAGGTQMLISSLVEKLSAEKILLNAKVIAIREQGHQLLLETADGRKFMADQVIVCLPPQLAGSVIGYEPQLPENVRRMLPTVQTWMAGTVKFTLEYAEPFGEMGAIRVCCTVMRELSPRCMIIPILRKTDLALQVFLAAEQLLIHRK